MKIKSLFSVALVSTVLAAAFFSGCGGGASCTSICEETNKCEGAMEQDCAKTCADSDKIIAETGCKSQADAALACRDGLADICKATADDCKEEAAAFLTCFTDFCAKNPDAESCKAP